MYNKKVILTTVGIVILLAAIVYVCSRISPLIGNYSVEKNEKKVEAKPTMDTKSPIRCRAVSLRTSSSVNACSVLLCKAMCWFELLYGGEGRRGDYRIISDSKTARMMAVQKGLGVAGFRLGSRNERRIFLCSSRSSGELSWVEYLPKFENNVE